MQIQCAESLKKIQQYRVIYSDPSSNAGVRECDQGVLGKIALHKIFMGKTELQ
jgi:hypothetical protein